MGDDKSCWQKLKDNLSVNTIGLSWWSGPSGKKRKVRPMHDECILDLIGKESSDVLILSKIESTPNDIYEEDLMSSNVQTKTLASPNLPKLLVTNNMKLKILIKKGELQPLRRYLNSFLDKSDKSLKVPFLSC